MAKKIVVSKSSDGDYHKIQDAINSIPEQNNQWIEVFIKEGVYYEKCFIEKSFLKLTGKSSSKTIITFDDYANKKYPDGKKYGTFNSYTIFIGSNNVVIENLTIENSSGKGNVVGQVIACYSDGDEISYKNCRFLGNQDTLFIGPLLSAPIISDGFFGPREFAERIIGKHFLKTAL